MTTTLARQSADLTGTAENASADVDEAVVAGTRAQRSSDAGLAGAHDLGVTRA